MPEQHKNAICPRCGAPMREMVRILVSPGANKYSVAFQCYPCEKIKWVDE
jgi:hypothetical protein